MKLLSTPSKIILIFLALATINYQKALAQIGTIKSEQDKAAALYRCFAEFTACPERKEYMLQLADYTECIGRQLNPATAGINCDRLRPKTDTSPNCPQDAERPEEATSFINSCTKSKGYDIPYSAGLNQPSGATGSANNAYEYNDQYKVAGQALATIFDDIREAREAKRQLRESRRTGTQADKNALLSEAADLRSQGRGKFIPFLLTAAGGLGIYSFISETQKNSDALENVSTNIIGIGGGLAVLIGLPVFISKISKSGKANKIERQANEMRISLSPLIMQRQNGVAYSGLKLKVNF